MAEKMYRKSELMSVLDALNVCFHIGIFSLEEKNVLLCAIKSKSLSEEQKSMLIEKSKRHPQGKVKEIIGFFE